MLHLLMLAAPAAAAAVPPKPGPEAGSWVTVADYPGEALAAHQEGEVGFRVEVDPEGRVTGCTIARSSGAESLDRATCALLAARARFTPARDAGGRAVAGSFSSRIRWVYPNVVDKLAAPPPVEIRELTSGYHGGSELRVGADGVITACERMDRPYANLAAPPDICRFFPVGARYAAPALYHGKPVKRKIRIEMTIDDTIVR